MKRKQLHNGTHLTYDERRIIQAGIENNSTKADIARTIGKDATTVAKEIRNHRSFQPRNTHGRPIVCGKMPHCATKPCLKKCATFEEPVCIRRDKSPGACNKCGKKSRCYWDKFLYIASEADAQYHRKLVESRTGFNLSEEERKDLGRVLAPLLKQKQSVYQIMAAHPEITVCEKSIYTYIESGLFKDFGIDNFSLKEQVNRKQRKTATIKKRKEPINFQGRKYDDFLRFRAENLDTPLVEMDTVLNSPSGPYLQTLIFEKSSFMIGFLHKEKTSASMAESFHLLQERLGNLWFSKLFSLILTDRGSEFEKFSLFELDTNSESRLSIFYCDPMQSSQKPHVENNHNYVRDVIPNSFPMDTLVQDDIDCMFSHINSTPRRSLGGKTPFEVFSFFYNEEIARVLRCQPIARDDVCLSPKLFRTYNR
jgi:Transposase and inactivated derivatives, IS30 family